MAKYIPDPSQLPPDEEQWVHPIDKLPVEPVETPEAIVARQVQEKLVTKSPEPVSVPAPVLPEIKQTDLNTSIKASSSALRKKRWREKHGPEALRKEREYLKAWRAKKKNG